MKDFEVNGNTAPKPLASVGWPDASCAASAGGVARGLAGGEASSLATGGAPACGEAPAGRRREAPALDLSLGHIGTRAHVEEIDYVADGPYSLELDYSAMTATLTIDLESPSSRAVRRASMRKLEKVIRVASQSGMRIVREVA